ncbi:MAG: VanZ family protein [Acidobacteriota bacterium]|nr:VanZ family protein [Acidobacteriota bacterium]
MQDRVERTAKGDPAATSRARGPAPSPSRSSDARFVLMWLAVVTVGSSVLGIWYLTGQSGWATTLLSVRVARWVSAHVRPPDDPTIDSFRWTWFGLSLRHWAHVVEFGLLSVFAYLAAVVFWWPRFRLRRLALGTVVACMACSLADQLHKVLLPDRHHDLLELVLDAWGYVVGTAIALALCTLATHLRRRLQRSAGPMRGASLT